MKPLLLFLTFGLLTGCAHKVWYQPGVTPRQAALDEAQCKWIVDRHVGIGVGFAAIATETQRHNLMRDCMEAKGYTLISDRELRKLTNSIPDWAKTNSP